MNKDMRQRLLLLLLFLLSSISPTQDVFQLLIAGADAKSLVINPPPPPQPPLPPPLVVEKIFFGGVSTFRFSGLVVSYYGCIVAS
jgi:hypothetical protein